MGAPARPHALSPEKAALSRPSACSCASPTPSPLRGVFCAIALSQTLGRRQSRLERLLKPSLGSKPSAVGGGSASGSRRWLDAEQAVLATLLHRTCVATIEQLPVRRHGLSPR